MFDDPTCSALIAYLEIVLNCATLKSVAKFASSHAKLINTSHVLALHLRMVVSFICPITITTHMMTNRGRTRVAMFAVAVRKNAAPDTSMQARRYAC